MVALIDAGLCTACGACTEMCMVQAIEVDEAARVNPEQCIGCGACVEVCPTEAVTMEVSPLHAGTSPER
jgi:ferredoxin